MPYWSINKLTEELDKPVYHIFENCFEGKKIRPGNKDSGIFPPSNHSLCEQCQLLKRLEQAKSYIPPFNI